ncbi:hypothetical protein [Nocardia inohanensis]|uniref:hypothetical protein n=1 Tax=Nocardia inohanensis TaxID=209246 RepID=UPI000836D12A|nr:hypothetical protein [Nocardia inohanensis]
MNQPEPQTPDPTSTTGRARDRARQRWHIDHIDTEILTPQQHDHALSLLADLITTWTKRPTRNPDTTDQQAA